MILRKMHRTWAYQDPSSYCQRGERVAVLMLYKAFII